MHNALSTPSETDAAHSPGFTEARQERTHWERARLTLTRAKPAIAGLVILALVIIMGAAAPVLAPHDPNEIVLDAKLTPPVWQEGGTPQHPLGTDELGRDVLSRIMYGARISLAVSLGTVVLGGLLGVTLGLLAGFYGWLIDDVISMVAEIQLAFPNILLALAMLAVIGPGIRNVILVLSISGWVVYGRVVRAQVLVVRQQTYVEAARVVGTGNLQILFRHILPNTAAPIIIIATFATANAILAEAFLSFLGLGLGPDVPTWGSMLAEGRELVREAWWLSTLPGLAIMLAVLGINLVGDWLRDFLDPRLRV